MKLCFNSAEDILIHSDGEISKCCVCWIIKKIKPVKFQIPINQCEKICNIKCKKIEIVDILLNYECIENCKCCGGYDIFKNSEKKELNINNIMDTLEFLISNCKDIKKIQIGAYFDSSSNVKNLTTLINLITEKYDLKITVFHTGIVSLKETEKLLTEKSINNTVFFININGVKEIHDMYKPNSFDIIYNNISKNKKLNITLSCLIFEESLKYLNEIFHNLSELSNNVNKIEIKIDNFIERLTKKSIVKILSNLKAFYFFNKDNILDNKVKNALIEYLNSNAEKARFALKRNRELKLK